MIATTTRSSISKDANTYAYSSMVFLNNLSLDHPMDVAQNKFACQSSTVASAHYAVNGGIMFSAVTEVENNPWFAVDLNRAYTINRAILLTTIGTRGQY